MNKMSLQFKFTFILLLVVTRLSMAQGVRTYHTNLTISGQTEDSQGPNYLLLHKIYTNTPIADNHVFGKITAIRGGTGASNRKWTVEVNTSSAYTSNRGSIISYNEPASLVTLTYNGESYLAVSIANSSTLFNFSFTGYAQSATFLLAKDDVVSNVQNFSTTDIISIQGGVGIGTTSTGIHKLAVEGSIGARKIKVNPTGWADFVFDPEYELSALEDVEEYIKANKHLPDVPSAEEVDKDGLDLGEMNKKLLQKVEELTLYMIELKKEINELKKHSTFSKQPDCKHTGN
ncbi:hypothetical protein [uncultured Chitinophaga sp.]|jgi:hypothetical protein|uniref:hypothetical protein n=1 Tax=uncultured Chitinophaga sp. TaxID=339340 RepID=UPI0026074608|nr:hypothetical protein [uncultured Chitinophaga sp.]